MLDALEFTPFPDAAPALERLRAMGLRLVVVSNWDCSLSQWLAPAGLLDLVDGVVSSGAVGAAKPDAAIFLRGLELAGVGAERAVHVGDSLRNDVEGARGLGIRAILLDRARRAPPGVEVAASLAELPSLV
jgi:putative hydrolase of the HAD superfamily